MWVVYVTLAVALTSLVTSARALTPTKSPEEQRLEHLERVVGELGRQAMLQQHFIDERTRSEGQSGIKAMRSRRQGTRPFLGVSSEDGFSIGRFHDNTDFMRLGGLGDNIYVMNGVQFQSKASGYNLKMPSRHSPRLNAVEDIPFPDVPPAVKNKKTVEEQIKEMREWFKAFKLQSHRLRDYRPYFKPVVCYLEASWNIHPSFNTHSPTSSLFHKAASGYFNYEQELMMERELGVQFSGRPTRPTLIYNVTAEGIPEFAYWDYRVLCNPLSQDVPTRYFLPLDDLASRLSAKKTVAENLNTQGQRFTLSRRKTFSFLNWDVLDDVMYEVPGKDNYQASLTYHDFDYDFYMSKYPNYTRLEANRYSRWFKVTAAGAMGTRVNRRGYADNNLFVSLTTQPSVAPLSVTRCSKDFNGCKTAKSRISYALPLEIVYLTPLHKWNPYNIKYKDSFRKGEGLTVRAGGRNGGSEAKALNGSAYELFYHTPAAFFNSSLMNHGASVDKRTQYVLDPHGKAHLLAASGLRIMMPDIPGVGPVRTRYPIVPMHQESSAAWRELDALKIMALNIGVNYWDRFYETPFRRT